MSPKPSYRDSPARERGGFLEQNCIPHGSRTQLYSVARQIWASHIWSCIRSISVSSLRLFSFAHIGLIVRAFASSTLPQAGQEFVRSQPW